MGLKHSSGFIQLVADINFKLRLLIIIEIKLDLALMRQQVLVVNGFGHLSKLLARNSMSAISSLLLSIVCHCGRRQCKFCIGHVILLVSFFK